MKKVLVTGAGGFLGSNLCRRLSEKGYEVIGLVRNTLPDISGVSFVKCDMSQYVNLTDILEKECIDTVFHFAWTGSAGELRGDYTVQLENIRYTCDLLKSCSKLGVRRFVFAASIMEYEIEKIVNMDMRLQPASIYCSAKLSADYMLKALAAGTDGMEYIRGVISNVYGPGEVSPRLVNSSIRKMLDNERCSFSPGEQMYDFIYIDDAADAFIAIGEKGLSDKTYYIGSPNPKPLKEFLIEMRDQISPGLELGLGDFEFNGVSLLYNEFDLNAVKNDTGFEPQYSFAEGIRRTAKWIKTCNV